MSLSKPSQMYGLFWCQRSKFVGQISLIKPSVRNNRWTSTLPGQKSNLQQQVDFKASIFDDPVSTRIINNSSPETYLLFKSARAELQAAKSLALPSNNNQHKINHIMSKQQLLPTLTLIATNNGDYAMLKTVPMIPVIALNVTTCLYPPYVISMLELISAAYDFDIVPLHTHPNASNRYHKYPHVTTIATEVNETADDDLPSDLPDNDNDPRSEV